MRTKKKINFFEFGFFSVVQIRFWSAQGATPQGTKKKRKEKTKEIKGREEKASFSVLLPSSSSFSVEVYILNLETI